MKKFIGLLCILLMLTLFVPVKQAQAHGGGGFLPGLIIGGVLGWGLTPHYYYPRLLLSTSGLLLSAAGLLLSTPGTPGTSGPRGILLSSRERIRTNAAVRRADFYLSPPKSKFAETRRGSSEMP